MELIPGGQNSSKRQTAFFLLVDPRDKEHKDPEKIDLSVPRRAQYLHNAFKGKSKTTTESTRWYNSNHTDARKKMD